MLIRLAKALWVGLAGAVLIATLYFYDGKDLSDVWVFLTWLMLILSFPAGTLISFAHFAIGEVFDTTVKTSYLSLVLEWTAYFVLGYLQWFKVVPYLVGTLQRHVTQRKQRASLPSIADEHH